MKVFVGIATSGRAQVLQRTINRTLGQSLRPEVIFICHPPGEKLGIDLASTQVPLIELIGERGTCTQRNRILDHLAGTNGLLLLIDDDFVLHHEYCEKLCDLLRDNPTVAIANGSVVADGITGPGLGFDEAVALVDGAVNPAPDEVTIRDIPSIYGCNMAVNMSLSGDFRFDENLPLYGWQEDVDYSSRIKAVGRVIKTNLVAGAHMGVKLGRFPGKRMGYSQIVNPLYLLGKGTMTPRHVSWLISKNILMNVLRFAKPEPYIDRRGRLHGNLIGIGHVVRGRIDPRRVLDL